jgi:copper chaperone CopZ
MDRLNLTIEGMSCTHCVRAVSDALRSVPGVSVEQVDIGAARLSYDPSQATVDQILDAVNDEGYTASMQADGTP